MILKKSSSNPTLIKAAYETHQASRPTKHNKQYIQQLEAEVNKSKIAIENMSHVNVMDKKTYKKVEQLKKELHFNILKINQETDKHKTLCEFIENLKGQMNEFEAVQKNSEEYQSNNFEKKIKKVEYDIKQILHKSNEEIAKINNLKEEANAARDERVVYSNLFNKIQKEIKHYQQIYKQTLIKNQIFLDKKKQSQGGTKPSESIDQIFQDTQQAFMKAQPNETSTRINKLQTVKRLGSKSREARKSSKRYETDMFITNIKDSPSRALIDGVKTSSQFSSSGFKTNVSLNRNLSNMIQEKEREIQRIIMTSECSNISDVFQYYNNIQQLNEALFQQVQLLNFKISTTEEELEAIQKIKRTSQTQSNQQPDKNHQQPSLKVSTTKAEQHSSDQLTIIALQICKILNVDCSGQKVLNDDLIKQIDCRIDDYANRPNSQRRAVRKDSKMLSAEEMSAGTQRGASQILDKIEKFNECQKIFDRNTFKMQYQKQVSKARKKGKKIN